MLLTWLNALGCDKRCVNNGYCSVSYGVSYCVVTLQLSQCQDRMLELEKHLENPMDPERVRFLEGSDLKPADLHVKLEEVDGANMRDGA